MKAQIIGKRGPAGRPIDDVLSDCHRILARLEEESERKNETLLELKFRLAPYCRAYYSLAAASRRSQIPSTTKHDILRSLFLTRTTVENSILKHVKNVSDLLQKAYSRSFYGASIKQGTSIRFALVSCVPTVECGGRCYAHDGRDRDIDMIFRGVLNYWIGESFESGGQVSRQLILDRMLPITKHAVRNSLAEAHAAAKQGFIRSPRIRFSHVGEMAQTPNFTNALASQIKSIAPEVECVLYSRHPLAQKLDGNLITVNFTLESSFDNRRRFAPLTSRLVGSAWDGSTIDDVAVNFIEHHIEKHDEKLGGGLACPVTIAPQVTPTCDQARCTACFDPIFKNKVIAIKESITH